jgi:hypothetical protein
MAVYSLFFTIAAVYVQYHYVGAGVRRHQATELWCASQNGRLRFWRDYQYSIHGGILRGPVSASDHPIVLREVTGSPTRPMAWACRTKLSCCTRRISFSCIRAFIGADCRATVGAGVSRRLSQTGQTAGSCPSERMRRLGIEPARRSVPSAHDSDRAR